MIYLKNYSQYNTYICLQETSYSLVGDVFQINGIGGFTEDKEMLGFYVKNDKFFFRYENKVFEIKNNNISCTNEYNEKGKRHFAMVIENSVVCEKIYKPYISPLTLAFEEDDEEFDFLLFLSRALSDETSVLRFRNGIEKLKV